MFRPMFLIDRYTLITNPYCLVNRKPKTLKILTTTNEGRVRYDDGRRRRRRR